MTVSLSTTVRNAEMDSITTAIGTSGLLRIFNGTPPATVGTALSGNTQLAELACSSAFAGSASSGVLTANAISDDSSADATGTASFFRIVKSDGTTYVVQGTVGTSAADCILNTTSIVAAGVVRCTSCVITAGNV